jgi:hypothetical protein
LGEAEPDSLPSPSLVHLVSFPQKAIPGSQEWIFACSKSHKLVHPKCRSAIKKKKKGAQESQVDFHSFLKTVGMTNQREPNICKSRF